MITEKSNKNELLTAIGEEVSQLQIQFSSLDDNRINSIPYEDSWTAGQLLRHVIKSNIGMAKALRMDSKPADRDPGERISSLKKVFLDFSNKMKSPDFIVPEEVLYEKQVTIEELNRSFRLLKKNATNANLTDIVEGFPLGTITKLEILHFVLYHTQRHLPQLKKICGAFKKEHFLLL